MVKNEVAEFGAWIGRTAGVATSLSADAIYLCPFGGGEVPGS